MRVRRTICSLAAATFLLLALSPATEAENWPHWRGPRFDGTSEATGLPSEWDREMNVKWRLGLPKGDITGDGKHAAWHLERGTPDVPSPLVHDGLVYLSGERGTLTCLDAKTGETLYDERVHSSPHRGSPVYADGKIFLTASDGTVSVVRPGREYELLGKNSVDERVASSLAVSDGTIYLRSYEALYALGEPEEGEEASSE